MRRRLKTIGLVHVVRHGVAYRGVLGYRQGVSDSGACNKVYIIDQVLLLQALLLQHVHTYALNI